MDMCYQAWMNQVWIKQNVQASGHCMCDKAAYWTHWESLIFAHDIFKCNALLENFIFLFKFH